jgi:predicted nucleic acid-binding Zn ribbon protein
VAPNESGGPEALAAALRRYLAASGLADRLEQATVVDDWPSLVGPAVAKVTKPLAVAADGTLFVAVRTPSWMNELALMEREILGAINRQRERGKIARIRWQLAR